MTPLQQDTTCSGFSSALSHKRWHFVIACAVPVAPPVVEEGVAAVGLLVGAVGAGGFMRATDGRMKMCDVMGEKHKKHTQNNTRNISGFKNVGRNPISE